MTGESLQHVILCGMPQSGSSFLYQIAKADADPTYKQPPHDMNALAAIAPTKNLITKSASDVFVADAIVEVAGERGKGFRFVLAVTDPRRALQLRHSRYHAQRLMAHDHGLFFGKDFVSQSNPGVLPFCEAISALEDQQEVASLTIRYEDLVAFPAQQLERLGAFTGRSFDIPPEVESILSSKSGLAPWQPADRAEAIRVVRQFRLAPRLFNYLELWNYASDRSWFEKLAADAPEAFDDRPGTIVGFHTDDPLYRGEAKRMRETVEQLGLPIDLTCVPDQGGWLANVRFKVDFLKDARRRLNGPILYVDVDAVFHSDPWPSLRGCEADVGFCTLRDGFSRSGTILIADTPGGVAFLDDWSGRLARSREAWDQAPLTEIMQQQMADVNLGYNVEMLPPSLCYIFDRGAVSDPPAIPVIEHLQASREAGGPTERLARRRSRIDEIEAVMIGRGD